MRTPWLLSLAATALFGCVAGDSDDSAGGGGKADGEGSCDDDPAYGDGTCQIDLACGIPDIDCFETFTSDADAAAWINAQRGLVALPETDPRFVRARELTNRAWETYRKVHHLGRLADAHVGVVVLDDPSINAWVTGSTETLKAALSVHYHSAILDPSLGDEEILGVVFHELAHVTNLHVLPEVYEKTQRYYVAGDVEQIGAFQADNARVRTHETEWLDVASFAGPYTGAALLDLPLGGNLGALFAWYLDERQAACPTQIDAVRTLMSTIGSSVGIDDDVIVTPQVAAQLPSALAALSACNEAAGAYSVRTMLSGDADWTDYLATAVAAEHQWLLDEPDGATALVILAGDRRSKLTSIAQAFKRELGAPWSKVRYFSTEEQADDVSVRATLAAQHAAPGVSLLMTRVLPDAAACETAITNKQVPYGVHLDDSHHGTCWRIAHARQLAKTPTTTARTLPVAPRATWTPTRPSTGEPMY